jgi:hypothetical protein
MSEVTSICGGRTFEFREAIELLPVVRRVTKEISHQADRLIDQLERMDVKDSEKTMAVEERVNDLILRWQQKLKKLGLQPRGLWFADFPAVEGYYSWSYPEMHLESHHGKKDGFAAAAHARISNESYEPVSETHHLKDSF